MATSPYPCPPMPALHSYLLPLMLLAAVPLACAQPKPADCLPANAAFGAAGWKTDFCTHSVPLDEIRSGGPPRDGIPPLDAPQFVAFAEADAWLEDEEPVIALTLDGEARAYPIQVLIWHEIVNDEVGGTPVAVTYCPLCNAAVAFVRPEVEGETLTFGTSGNLRRSDLVMWDRQTESWWQQFTGEAIVGRLTGTQLALLPAPIVSWQAFRARHPEGLVLSRETGFDRAYGRNPYVGYDDVSQSPFLYDGPLDGRLRPMDRVVGVELGGTARAYAFDALRAERVVNDELGGISLAVLWAPGTASALDRAVITEGRDVGAAGVFRRALGGRTLTLEAAADGRFRDAETGSTWTALGKAVDGPLRGETLEAVAHHAVFWFVWAAFQPKGTLYGAPSDSTQTGR